MKSKFYIIGAIILAVSALFWFRPEPSTAPADTQNNTPVRIFNLKPNDLIVSPFKIEGEALGSRYFEASFPIRLVDAAGQEIATTVAQAQADWMTASYVPFEATVEFSTTSQTGVLMFLADNPSGDPKNEKPSFNLPLKFK